MKKKDRKESISHTMQVKNCRKEDQDRKQNQEDSSISVKNETHKRKVSLKEE